MIVRALLTLLTFAATAAATAAALEDQPAVPTTAPAILRVMSFNVRYGTAPDGPDHWDKRKPLFFDTIRAYGPDLLGMQEVIAAQADQLQRDLPGYAFIGTGRDDGKRRGEYSPLMFRKDRFELIESGQYWLSETPDVVASKGWDAALPRIVTWAKLKDRLSGRPLLWINTHWDHVGNKARVESAKLMRHRVEQKREPGVPVVVTGDFNSDEDSAQYRTLVSDEGGLKLTDAYREVHPQRQADEASFHAFKGKREGLRIDWVLHSPELVARGAAIDHASKDGRYPSDHFPVTAELELAR
jgi:endonuclease/exonuclease/phosphatase family metal-dependent hydrolase